MRTTAALLLLLAGYQIVEVAICSALPAHTFLPRLAFLVVTWLPPLGILLVSFLLGPGARAARWCAYGMLGLAVGMVVWILFDPGFATLSVCHAVYARYDHPTPSFLLYGAFYWLGLAGLVGLSAYGAVRPRGAHNGRLARLVLTGSVGFIVPAILTSRFVPAGEGALPSVMCHFAILLAALLVRLTYIEQKNTSSAPQPNPSPVFQ